MFNFRCNVVDIMFQFENIHQNFIVYLFIHDLFYEYNIIVKQHTLQETSFFLILKSHLFWL